MSLLNANAVLRGWHLGVGGVEANGLTGVGGGFSLVWWGSTIVSGGGGSGRGQIGVLTADSGSLELGCAGAVRVETVLGEPWLGRGSRVGGLDAGVVGVQVVGRRVG